MRSFSKKLAFVLAAAMVVTAFAPAAKAEAAKEMAINKQGKILYVTDGKGINDAAQVGGGKGNVSSYDFAVSNKPADWKTAYTFAWSSSDEDVITVKNGGLTTAVGAGKADVVCVVTEKATGKATTLKNTVTVKANAADVVITNADDYANTAVEVGDVVDLNRAMYDANGTKAPKRGVVVTDYTRWMVEPSTGVKVDSTKGTFTFTEEAVAGEYKLWAETYQSKKYQATTAKSDVVKVELVKDMTLELKQTTTTKFDVYFNSPVKSLVKADVKVSRMLGTYEYNQVVKSVALSQDKMSATVEIFNKFVDGVDYTVKVNGFEDYTMTASNGKPVRLEIVALDSNGNVKDPSMVLYTGESTKLASIYYDAKDVVVDYADHEKVRYTLDKTASSKEVTLSGEKLTIKKNTASATVVASYPGWIENGKRVGAFTGTQVFFAEDKAPVVPARVTQYTLDNTKWWGSEVHKFQMESTPTLYVMIEQSDWGNANQTYKNGDQFKGETKDKNYITFTALDPAVAVIASNGKITANKPGIASFYVNYKAWNASLKKYEELPFAVVDVEIEAKSYTESVSTFSNVKVGTHDDYCTTDVYLLGKDQYGNRFSGFGALNASNFKIECLSEGYGDQEVLAGILDNNIVQGEFWWDGSGKSAIKVAVNAQEFRAQLAKGETPAMTLVDDGEFVDLEFKATYTEGGRAMTTEFTITIQEPSGNSDDNIIDLVASDGSKDVLRKKNPYWSGDSCHNEKTINFKVNVMNNDVQVGTISVDKFNAKAAADGAYQFKILKDGEDITSSAYVATGGHVVTIHPSYVKPIAEIDARAAKVISGGVVSYDILGEATYTFELYKWTKNSEGTLEESLENTSDIAVYVSDAGKYNLNVEKQKRNVIELKHGDGNYDAAFAKDVLLCFTITDTANNNIVSPYWNGLETGRFYDAYYVNYTAVAESNYVYVKEIVFYEKVAEGAYVAFTVPVDISLDWNVK